MIKRFLHLAVTTGDLEASAPIYEALGMKQAERFECPEPKAAVLLMEDAQGTGVELWKFHDTNHPHTSLIDGHTAYETDALEEDTARLLSQGFLQAMPPDEDSTLRFAMLQAPNGQIIELCQYKSPRP